MDKRILIATYQRIIEQEQKHNCNYWSIQYCNPNIIYGITKQLLEIANQSLVQRSFIENYHLTSTTLAFESVGAHTNLLIALIDRTLNFICNETKTEKIVYGFTYREIVEAARRHDLPENIIGDIPDDGNLDEQTKSLQEQEYWKEYAALSPLYDRVEFEVNVWEILNMMNARIGKVGRLLYVADKASAILTALQYDICGYSPVKLAEDELGSLDSAAIEYCDKNELGVFKASELWTVTYLKLFKTVNFDETGFITAIIIMATLIANEEWYSWREKDYI